MNSKEAIKKPSSPFVGVRPAIIGYSLFRIKNWCRYDTSHIPKFSHQINYMCSCVLPTYREFDQMAANPAADHYIYNFFENEIVISHPNGNSVHIWTQEEEPDWFVVEEQLDGIIFDEQGSDKEFEEREYVF